MDYISLIILGLSAIQIVLLSFIAFHVSQPKMIQMPSRDGIKEMAVITPAGTFMKVDKRDPVYNDDEALFMREDGQKIP